MCRLLSEMSEVDETFGLICSMPELVPCVNQHGLVETVSIWAQYTSFVMSRCRMNIVFGPFVLGFRPQYHVDPSTDEVGEACVVIMGLKVGSIFLWLRESGDERIKRLRPYMRQRRLSRKTQTVFGSMKLPSGSS